MVHIHLTTALSRRVLSRWRTQGFDVVNQFPSGFCSPMSSRHLQKTAPDGYVFHPIDSAEAVDAVATAIERGASYTYRELGQVGPISDSALAALGGLRILVVEDRLDTRDLVRVILETCGARVIAVESAAAALDLLGKESYDLLVSDVMMPGLNGFDLMRSIRERGPDQGGSIPSIALTALDDEDHREKALEAGFQIYLIKPIAPASLVEAIVTLATVPDKHLARR